MPASSRKMAVPKSEQIDDRNGGISGANTNARDSRQNNGQALSKVNKSSNTASSPKSNGMSRNSALQPFTDKETKIVKEEPLELSSGASPGGGREDGQRLSIPSRYPSKLAPICSSPLLTAESSRTHMFSPPAPSAKVS